MNDQSPALSGVGGWGVSTDTPPHESPRAASLKGVHLRIRLGVPTSQTSQVVGDHRGEVRANLVIHSFIQLILVECPLRDSKCVRHYFRLCDLGPVTISAPTAPVCKVRALQERCPGVELVHSERSISVIHVGCTLPTKAGQLPALWGVSLPLASPRCLPALLLHRRLDPQSRPRQVHRGPILRTRGPSPVRGTLPADPATPRSRGQRGAFCSRAGRPGRGGLPP